MLKRMLSVVSISLLLTGTAFAQENEAGPGSAVPAAHKDEASPVSAVPAVQEETTGQPIPDQVNNENWAYREIKELVEKYDAKKTLPEKRSCTKDELAQCLLSVMEKVVEKYEKEGPLALRRDDMERISALNLALEGEVASQGGFRTIRSSIKEILALVEPEEPAFLYKVGVNGFLRGEHGRNFRLPDEFAPGHSEGRFTWRVKPYAYWHPTDYLDVHVEGQSYGFAGENQSFDRFSLYQGFAEVRTPEKNWVALKGGRQEFVYGSAFVQGSDSAFDGLTFDGARLRLEPLEVLKIDLLGGAYATPFSGGVKGNLYGAYATYAPSEDSGLDMYLFRDTGSEEHFNGEYLNTWGLRSTSKLGPLALEIEPVAQTGKVFNPETGANDTISTLGGHVDLTGEAELAGRKHTFLVSYAVGSGSQDAVNGISSSKEFRNSNNDTPLVGDMHVVGDLSGIDVGESHASGLQVYTLGWGVELTDELSFAAIGHKFIANNVPDGFSRNVGVEADFSLSYKFSKDLSLTLAYDHFFTEKFFLDASGSSKNVGYASALLTFNLDKTKRKAMKS